MTVAAGDRKRLSLNWTRERQEISVDGAAFVHDGPTSTYPSHDLAHLLVGATTTLEWNPTGSRRHVRLAEYNAVLLDTLFSKVGYAVRDGHKYQPSVLGASLRRMRWFVYKHYAPFPIEAEEAYCRFCHSLAADRLLRLSPLYFDYWLAENSGIVPAEHDWRLSFHDDDNVPPASELVVRCQAAFGRLVGRMMKSAGRTWITPAAA